jgi:hypothetical protein
MSGHSNLLDYLHEAKRGLGPEQAQAVDDLLLGMSSVLISRDVWESCVQMAVKLAEKRA